MASFVPRITGAFHQASLVGAKELPYRNTYGRGKWRVNAVLLQLFLVMSGMIDHMMEVEGFG